MQNQEIDQNKSDFFLKRKNIRFWCEQVPPSPPGWYLCKNAPTPGWLPTRRKCTTGMEFGTYTLLSKLTPGANCHGWSPTIPWRVTRQPMDGHPPEGHILQTWNLALRLRPGDNWHNWSPTIPRMFTHQPKYKRRKVEKYENVQVCMKSVSKFASK